MTLPHCVCLAQGDAATEIVQFAMRENVDLIAMPTRGCGVFRKMLLGSVTAKVLHDASCPVWTSSHTEHVTPGPLSISDRSVRPRFIRA